MSFAPMRGTCYDARRTHKAIWYWDSCSALLLVVVTFLTPLESGFLPCPQTGDFRWFVNQTMTLYFALDMILQFLLPYLPSPDPATLATSEKPTIKRYLKTWFIIDLISVVPFDVVLGCGDDSTVNLSVLRTVRLMRLLRLLRLTRGFRMLRRWETKIGIPHRKLMLYTIFLTAIVAAHWIACVLGIVSRMQGVMCVGPPQYYVPDCTITWLSLATLPSDVDVSDPGTLSPANAYIIALHASMSIIVHPHHYTPTGPGERIAFIILMGLGGFIWAQVISRTTAICTSLDKHDIQYKTQLDDLNLVSRDLGLPHGLKRNLRLYFRNTKDSYKFDTWAALMKRMSPQLRREAAREVNRLWVRRIGFLSQCPVAVISEVTEAMFHANFCEGELFGELYQLHVLTKGSAFLHSRLRVVRQGAVWGEDHLLLSCVNLLSDNTAQAREFSACAILSKNSFDEVINRYPNVHGTIRKGVVRMAAIRGFCLAAKRRRLSDEAVKTADVIWRSAKEKESGHESMVDASQRLNSSKQLARRNSTKQISEMSAKERVQQLGGRIEVLAGQMRALFEQQQDMLTYLEEHNSDDLGVIESTPSLPSSLAWREASVWRTKLVELSDI